MVMVLCKEVSLNKKMDNPKNQIAQKLKDANNVLVTVSANPTVDQLAAAIGLTLLLNKLDKHASAVFSGNVPSTIEFLRPEETIEKNTDSLRDFIISLDKTKADKLRYKVEDKMVKIFITPYRTSITDQDLIFSQGDFNVDVVVGIGVKVREDLDQAIVAHGGILHDATVVSINTAEVGSIGSINWVDVQASSLCEMIVAEAELLKSGLIDAQIATALLTGIVAETDRFSNAKTSSNTMNASAKLMAAGANQQLVATQLEVPETPPAAPEQQPPSEPPPYEPEAPSESAENTIEIDENGTLQVEHQEELPEPQDDAVDTTVQADPEPTGNQPVDDPNDTVSRQFMTQPPVQTEESGTEVANESVEAEGSDSTADTVQDPVAEKEMPADEPEEKVSEPDELQQPERADDSTGEQDGPDVELQDASEEEVQPLNTENMAQQFIETPLQTIDAIEHIVDSPHVTEQQNATEDVEGETEQESPLQPVVAEGSDLDSARNAVQAAMEQTAVTSEEPGQSTDQASELGEIAEDLPDIHIDPDTGNISPPPTVVAPTVPVEQPAAAAETDTLMPPPLAMPSDPISQDPNAPPPVPPPMMPPMSSTSTTFQATPNPFSLPPA